MCCLADEFPEETLISHKEIGSYKEDFSHEDYRFGRDQFTFKVHVFDIKGFVSLQVRLVQEEATKFCRRTYNLKVGRFSMALMANAKSRNYHMIFFT